MTASKYKNTELGPIPEDWGVEYLGQLCTRIGDGIHSTPNYSLNGEYCFVNGNNLVNGKIHINSDTKRVNNDEFLLHKRELTKKTILLSINGTIGNLAIYNNEKIILGKSAAYLNINDKTYLKFLYFSLQSTITKNFIENALTGTTIRNLGLNSIRSLPIPLPPSLTEQKAIATALSDTDALISSLEQLISKKRAIKEGAMQELLKPKDGWEVKKLGDVGDIITGSTPLTEIKKYWNGSIPWITPTDINHRKNIYVSERLISEEGLKVIRKLPANTLLVTCIASIGKNTILRNNGACNQQINAVVPNEKNNVDFLYYLIELNKNILIGKAGITATLMISKKEFSEISFYIPSKSIQDEISTILSDMDTEIENLEIKLHKYKQIKQGMMQQLLTGKIRLI